MSHVRPGLTAFCSLSFFTYQVHPAVPQPAQVLLPVDHDWAASRTPAEYGGLNLFLFRFPPFFRSLSLRSIARPDLLSCLLFGCMVVSTFFSFAFPSFFLSLSLSLSFSLSLRSIARPDLLPCLLFGY